MQSLFNSFKAAAASLCSPYMFVCNILMAGLCCVQTTFGQTEENPCSPSDYSFLGVPEATLCDQFGNLTCNVEVGFGTPITHSSQLGTIYSGNVCIKGDFRIDNNFKFINCVIRIDPGVTIFVLPPHAPAVNHIFTIDNSKLFACEEMWNGITLFSNTTISTKNGTIIEDALAAIKADNIQFSTLLIENTTFNRNEIGILLSQDPSLPVAATIAKFNTNKFFCKAPLNGTTNQIGYAGIKTVNVPFTINPVAEAFHNRFEGLQYGIVAEGANTVIAGRFFQFRNLRRDGIRMNEGSLILSQSFWHNCVEKGVNISLAHRVDIRESCLMTINTDIPVAAPNIREGVYVGAFGINSRVNLSLGIHADLAGETKAVRGIHLKGGNVGSGTKINIYQSNISIRSGKPATASMESAGVFLEGTFPISSETHIYGNNFFSSSYGPITNSGIRSEGEKNNLNIYANNFGNFQNGGSGFEAHIYLDSSSGIGNYIADNTLNFATGRLFWMISFQNATICHNIASSTLPSGGFEFWGINPGTDFLNNEIYATGGAVNIFTNSIIGPQSQKGNKWYLLYAPCPPPDENEPCFYKSNYHAQCQTAAYADLNKFTVHTNQSVWNNNTETYDFFSEFHPDIIIPDLMDEFFEKQNGAPSSGCSVQFNEPGGDELDKTIADGLMQVFSADPSMDWIAKCYLYKKLMKNPALVGTYASYPTFLTSYANTNIGRFYEVNKKIADAFWASESLSQQSREILDDMDEVLADLTLTDSLLENSQDYNQIATLSVTKSDYLEQLRALQAKYDSVYASYKTHLASLLQQALLLNQQITPADQLESNEKAVTGIWLQSVLNQGGSLTESQVAELKSIGQQCSETGGLAIKHALLLLPECEKTGLPICMPELAESAQPLSYYTPGGQGLIAPPATSGSGWLYPNPASSSFYVELPEGESGKLQVSDLTGKPILQRQLVEPGVRMEISVPLAPGIYLVRIWTDKGTTHTNKIIIHSR